MKLNNIINIRDLDTNFIPKGIQRKTGVKIGKLLNDFLIYDKIYSINSIYRDYNIEYRTFCKYIQKFLNYRSIKNSLGKPRRQYYLKPKFEKMLKTGGNVSSLDYKEFINYIYLYKIFENEYRDSLTNL